MIGIKEIDVRVTQEWRPYRAEPRIIIMCMIIISSSSSIMMYYMVLYV